MGRQGGSVGVRAVVQTLLQEAGAGAGAGTGPPLSGFNSLHLSHLAPPGESTPPESRWKPSPSPEHHKHFSFFLLKYV